MSWHMTTLRLLAPPAHTWQLLSWDLTSANDLRLIRTGLHQFFEVNQTGQSAVEERMALVVTELAGNALRHGQPPIVIRLLRDDDCYILDVADHAPNHAPQPAVGHQQPHAGGRGLLIARSLAEQLCWYRGEHTKHVWASFPAPPPEPRNAPGL
jgi:serine/threonine-protein kinase RsbW